MASPRTSAMRADCPAARTFRRPSDSIAAAKSTPSTRAAARPSRATSAVPVQTSRSVSRPVSCSERMARARQRRSIPALRTRFSRSYRGAIASNMPAMRSGALSGAVWLITSTAAKAQRTQRPQTSALDATPRSGAQDRWELRTNDQPDTHIQSFVQSSHRSCERPAPQAVRVEPYLFVIFVPSWLTQIQRDRSHREVDDADVAVQVKRLLHLRQIVCTHKRLLIH